MKNNKLGSLFWILLVVCILNIVGHLAVYPALPDTVPTHWGASGEVNGWSSKQSNLIFCVLPLAMLVFMEVVRRIDPKHQNFERFGKVWNIFITLMVLLTAGMTWLTELTVFDVAAPEQQYRQPAGMRREPAVASATTNTTAISTTMLRPWPIMPSLPRLWQTAESRYRSAA